MSFSKIGFFSLLVLLGMVIQGHAQSSNLFGYTPKNYDHTEFAAILLNGEALIKERMPDGPLSLKAEASGTFTVSLVDRITKEPIAGEPIGFKIGIKDYRSNTLWMYSEKTFYEIDLGKIASACGAGDIIVFMTVDRRYHLARHEILGSSGC